jgi:hypothetical protein
MIRVLEEIKQFSMVILGTIAFTLGSGSVIISCSKIWVSMRQTTPVIGTVVSVKKLEIQQYDLSYVEKTCPVIRFQAANGRTIDYLEEFFCNSLSLGRQVKVMYNPRNPRSATIANGSRLITIGGWSAIAFIGLCLGVFGIGALWNGMLGSVQSELD